jgi:Tetratricopeptide repeat
VADLSNNLASVLDQEGSLDRALHLFKTGRQTYVEMGDEHGIAMTSNNIASILIKQGHLNEATRICQELLPLERAIQYKIPTELRTFRPHWATLRWPREIS